MSSKDIPTAVPITTTSITTSNASAMIGGSYGDRKLKPLGLTALTANTIEIGSWELKPATLCTKFCLALKCSEENLGRSYIYIRSNGSIELNDTNGVKACCTCCWGPQDDIKVYYFDRSPLADTCNIACCAYCCCIPYRGSPKIETIDNSCMCCCMKIDPCCRGKEVVIMPFEQMPPPCCCCSNRTGCCDNCCGFCGPPTGNPKIFDPFSPQPKDPSTFVAAVQQATMAARQMKAQMKAGAPDVDTMER